MKKLAKILAFVMAAAMLLSLGAAALASGEASGSAVPPPPSSMAQNTEDMKNFAAISVMDGVIASDETAVTDGVITEHGVSGAYASYDGIGDWDGSTVFGHFGAVLSGGDETPFVIGGVEELYNVDGEDYNTVFILDAQDKDVENALGSGEMRDYKDSREGAEGAGIYADMPYVNIENAYIYTAGYGWKRIIWSGKKLRRRRSAGVSLLRSQ